MKKKEDIMQEIARLKAASPSARRAAFVALEEEVEAHFTPSEELARRVGDCAFQVAFNYEYRNTVYENQSVMPTFSENYPKGYEDVREIFDGGGVWDELAEMDGDAFAEMFQVGTMSESDTTTAAAMLLEEWTGRVAAARAAILPALAEISEFCEADATKNGSAVYYEEHGGIVSAPTRREVAERVYLAGGYAEVIHAYGLDVRIPTYIDE